LLPRRLPACLKSTDARALISNINEQACGHWSTNALAGLTGLLLHGHLTSCATLFAAFDEASPSFIQGRVEKWKVQQWVCAQRILTGRLSIDGSSLTTLEPNIMVESVHSNPTRFNPFQNSSPPASNTHYPRGDPGPAAGSSTFNATSGGPPPRQQGSRAAVNTGQAPRVSMATVAAAATAHHVLGVKAGAPWHEVLLGAGKPGLDVREHVNDVLRARGDGIGLSSAFGYFSASVERLDKEMDRREQKVLTSAGKLGDHVRDEVESLLSNAKEEYTAAVSAAHSELSTAASTPRDPLPAWMRRPTQRGYR
jgi:hypothetical protein